MARETKVGLLVGLGVILLIGIIVSDTLSPAQPRNPAPMESFAAQAQRSYLTREELAAMPGAALPDGAAALAEGRSPGRRGPLLMPDEEAWPPSIAAPPPAHEVPPSPGMPELAQRRVPIAQAPPLPGDMREAPPLEPAHLSPPVLRLVAADPPAAEHRSNPGSPRPAPLAVHVVQPGDTLYRLGQHYYRDASSWKLIESANREKLDANGGKLRSGAELVIPLKPQAERSLDELRATHLFESADERRAPGAAEGVRLQLVEVKAGDTLAALALRHLGSRQRWPELLQANQDTLRKPEDLKVGQSLRIPGTSGGGAAAASGGGSPQAPRKYVVQAGDTPTRIASKTLGDGNRWREIMAANRDQVSSPTGLKIGQVLNIPAGPSR